MSPLIPDPPIQPKPIPQNPRADPLIQFRNQCGLTWIQEIQAKIELLMGLLIMITGCFVLGHLTRADIISIVLLIVLTGSGAYLALAGYRKLQYHSHVRLVSYLAGLIRDFPPERRP